MPTPTTDSQNDRSSKYAQGGMPLAYAVKLLPTPRANKVEGYSSPGYRPTLYQALLPTPTVSGNHNRKGVSANSGDGLSTAVKKLLRTPAASDAQTGYMGPGRLEQGRQINLETQIRYAGKCQTSGLLNPRFVEQMMGYPPGWCELAPVPNNSKATATP
nr:hypothetical protein [Hymenobacter glacieicola]